MVKINKKVIYKIRNLNNDKIYVGSTVNYSARRQEHFRDLVINKHHSCALQRAFNKYGKDSFVFEIIEYVDEKNLLIQREQFYIDTLSPEYNCAKVAGSALGVKKSAESNRLNSLRNRGDKNANAKLNDADVFKIVDLRKDMTTKELANLFNVSVDTISRVLNGKSFKHLNIKVENHKKIYKESARNRLSKLAIGRTSAVAIPVKVFSLNNEFIGEFESISKAASFINMDITSVCAIVKGETKNPKFKVVHAGME